MVKIDATFHINVDNDRLSFSWTGTENDVWYSDSTGTAPVTNYLKTYIIFFVKSKLN